MREKQAEIGVGVVLFAEVAQVENRWRRIEYRGIQHLPIQEQDLS